MFNHKPTQFSSVSLLTILILLLSHYCNIFNHDPTDIISTEYDAHSTGRKQKLIHVLAPRSNAPLRSYYYFQSPQSLNQRSWVMGYVSSCFLTKVRRICGKEVFLEINDSKSVSVSIGEKYKAICIWHNNGENYLLLVSSSAVIKTQTKQT